MHLYLEENGFPLVGKLGAALIDKYGKSGRIGNANIVFERVEERGVGHWNAMING